MTAYRSVVWVNGSVRMLDQRRLPQLLSYVDLHDLGEVAAAIRDMAVRGAPAIGVAAAYGLALAAAHSRAGSLSALRTELEAAGQTLRAARPTAVNLAWAIERVLRLARASGADGPSALAAELLAEAEAIAEEDIRVCRAIGRAALPLIPHGAIFIHHCNTGALAAIDYGTALGIIRTAHEAGRDVFVYVDETRPRLQGARLTTWELQQLGIPHVLIVDGASGHVMRNRRVDLVTVGCDRVAANGDTANKVGTYNLALAAKAHGVPFYVAAPTSTIDLNTPTGAEIPIEEREAAEVACYGAEPIAPEGTPVFNPAFDITPAAYITAFVTENGLAYPPFADSLRQMVAHRRPPQAEPQPPFQE